MSKKLILRALVNERLTAAAEEIFGVVERFILEYEDEVFRSNQELDRQRRLLDNLSFHNEMPDINRTDLPQLSDSEEEVPLEQQERSPSLGQEEPEPPRIREERAELWTNQAEAQLWTNQREDVWASQREELWANQKEEKLPLGPTIVPVKTEQAALFSEFSQSHVEMWENPNVERGEGDPPPCTSTRRMKTEPGGEGCGPSGSACDSERPGGTEPIEDFQEEVSDDFEDGDDCEESGGPALDRHALKLNNIHVELSQELQSWSQAPSTPYCKVSRISFSSKYSLRNHVKALSKDCSLSGRQLEPAGSLRSHFKTHIMCNVCHKTFASNRILTMHMRTHTGERPFGCLVCGRTFSQSGNLLRHRRIHTGEKPFCCSVCGKTFSQRGNLLRHRKLHMGRYPIAAQFAAKVSTTG